MDQVKAFAKVVWEQRFWVLSVLGTIIVLITWLGATGALDSQFNTRKSAIDDKFSQMSQITRTPDHPNDEVIKEEEAQARRQREFVLNVWKSLYDRQREEVLYWPRDNVLGENFVEYIEKRKFLDPISGDMRDSYSNYIKRRFDGLVEIAKALKLPDTGTTTGMRGRGARGAGSDMDGGGYGREGYSAGGGLPDGEEDQDYLVLWLDQDKVREKLNFERRPSAKQVWVTQEDLWVYESLLNVIARTNEARGATRPDNAAIKAIVSLDIGREANMSNNTEKGLVMVPRSAAAGAGTGMDGDFGGGRGGYGMEGDISREGPEGMDGYGRGGGYGRGEMDGDGSAEETLLAYRYLDSDGKPVPSGDTFGVEYRQLPVRLVLMMDQRWLPQLLIEAANASLPLEVKQVRLNPNKVSSLTDGGRGGYGGGFGGRGGGYGRGGMAMSGLTDLTSDPAVAEVDLRGAVYIYNEPDPIQLEVPGGEEFDDDQLAQF